MSTIAVSSEPRAWTMDRSLALVRMLVHAPNGWFVVGARRNGVEFSVLLMACLVAVALPHLPRTSRS
jgi:hypothetical protein